MHGHDIAGYVVSVFSSNGLCQHDRWAFVANSRGIEARTTSRTLNTVELKS